MQLRYLQVCGQVSTLTDTTTLTLTGSGSISHFMCLSAFCEHNRRQTGGQRKPLALPWRRAWGRTWIWSMESMMIMMLPW